MGILVNIYRAGRDCTNGGESSFAEGFCVVNAEGPFEPSERYPAAELVVAEPMGGRKILRLIPESVRDRWTMFGGNYAGTSDGRFGALCEELLGFYFYGAVAINDTVI